MLFNDILLMELLVLVVTMFYATSTNLLNLLCFSGLYLLALGCLMLLADGDIYSGFLWVIDLGVGLVFFIFMIHFTSFFFQKAQFNLTVSYFFLLTSFVLFAILWSYYFAYSATTLNSQSFTKLWFFRLTFTDYYFLFSAKEVTELNLLKDSYFLLNSFEFFVVNFSLLFGLLASMLLCFMSQSVFNFLNYSQVMNFNVLGSADAGFFIKSQNFITQQSTPGVVKVWGKSKPLN